IPQAVAELEEHPVVVKRADRATALVSAAKVENETACGFEHAQRGFAEMPEPVDVFRLLLIPVRLLPQEGERRTGNDEIHRGGLEQPKSWQAVAGDLEAEAGPVDLPFSRNPCIHLGISHGRRLGRGLSSQRSAIQLSTNDQRSVIA